MSHSNDLASRLAALQQQAGEVGGGATAATFRDYEALWREARSQGATAIATQALRDLAALTAELDPATARLLEQAAAPLDLSVIVLGMPGGATDSPLLASLDRQTLPRARFETLLAERSDAHAINEAASAARGRILLFVAPDVELSGDALSTHVHAHAASAPETVVLGALDRDGLHLRPLPWALERLGLFGCQHAAESGGAVPSDCLSFDHASVSRDAFEGAGGCDETLSAFAVVELGARLARKGTRCVLTPSIGAKGSPALDLDQWLARARAMGADWLRLRRKHGEVAMPAWLRELGLEEGEIEKLYAALLAGADVQQRRIGSLRASLHEIEAVLARDPVRADASLARVGADLTALLLEVTRHELTRGFVHAAHGGALDALERCTVGTRRGAAVLVAAGASAGAIAAATLSTLPEWSELLVAVPSGRTPPTLPKDPRVTTLALPASSAKGALRRALLAATGADFFLLLDGSRAPTRAEWDALRTTLATLPTVGACGVDGERRGPARAQPTTKIGEALVATRREVIEGDSDETGPYLERLVRRGFRLAAATAGRTETEPATCSG